MKSKINPAVLPVLNTHWAMEPTALAQMERRLLALPAGLDVAAKYSLRNDPQAALLEGLRAGLFDGDGGDGAKPRKPYEMAGGIAVLRLSGPLQKDPSWLMRYFGGTSTRAFIAMLALAEGDPDVGAICVVADSPGGDIDGTADAAEAVYGVRQRGKKSIVGAVDGCCCSAAYWIASQCSKVFGGQTSVLGSIGTRWSMIDTSAAYELLGLKKVEVTSGTYKAAGADGLAITDEDVAYFQGIVTDMQARFSAGVVRGRKLSTDAVKALAADAKIYVGKNAQDVGLIDEVASVPDVIRQLQKQAVKGSMTASAGGTGATMADKEKKGFKAAFTDFMAQFGTDEGDGEDRQTAAMSARAEVPAAGVVLHAGSSHPVLVAALAAGLDTPEKMTALVAERQARQDADTEAQGQALTTAREAAQSAAVTAFGAGSDALKAAQDAIAAQDKPAALASLTASYKAIRPASLRPNGARQTAAPATETTPGEDEALAARTATQEGLDAGKIYGKRRTRQ